MTDRSDAYDDGLVVENLSVDLDRPILRGLSLHVPRGRILSLVGPSGCGKTTLLKTIAGLTRQRGGQIRIDGHDVSALPARSRPTGLVFQTPTLFPGVSVRDNIAFGLDDTRMSDARREDRIESAMAIMNVRGLANRMPGDISGGQGQRVSLARTLVRRPRVLLLDEPVAHVEASLRRAIHADIDAQVRRMGLSAIYVTHDIDEACTVGDDIAIMADGRIIQAGSPRSVYERPDTLFAANLMGVENILAGTVTARRGTTADTMIGRVRVSLPCHDDVAPGPATVFITPESIVLTSSGPEHVRGQVIAVGFARSHMVYDIETDLGTLVVHEPTTGPARAVGDPVSVTLARGWVRPGSAS